MPLLPDIRDIPTGWERSPVRGDEIELQHQDEDIAVKVVKATLADEWELELVDNIGNQFSTVRPVGRVDTRERAIEELVSFAEAVDNLRTRDEALPDDIVREVQRNGRAQG
ncbi:hypothetical protein [Haladaptatus sp. NG-SE-30]